MYVDVTVLF